MASKNMVKRYRRDGMADGFLYGAAHPWHKRADMVRVLKRLTADVWEVAAYKKAWKAGFVAGWTKFKACQTSAGIRYKVKGHKS